MSITTLKGYIDNRKKCMNDKSDYGYSLIELVTAVGVLLILTLVGVMTISGLNANAKKSTVEQAVETAYNKAMAAELDNDSKTSPKEIETEYNDKSDDVTVNIQPLGNGRLKVIATHSDGITQATRITPVSGSSSDNGGEYIPDEDEDSTQIKDNISEIVLQCSDTKTGRLPILNIGEDTDVVLVDNSGERTVIETETVDSSMFGYGNGAPKDSYKDVYNATKEVTLEKDQSYRVIVTGEVEKIMGFTTKDSINGLNTCIKSVPELGEDSGITTISLLGSTSNYNMPESIDPELPSSVTNLRAAFIYSNNFQQDLSTWDMSNVTDTSFMFFSSRYNQDLSTWNMANVETTEAMFQNNYFFDQDLSGWDISKVENTSSMFSSTFSFNNGNKPLTWKTGSLLDTSKMFNNAQKFNQDISSWDMSKVTNMVNMFNTAYVFNQNLNGWDTSSVKIMNGMFEKAYVFNNNGETLKWDTRNVTSMDNMFKDAHEFNQSLDFDTSKVTNMSGMFRNTRLFNQNISHWNVSKVSNMDNMFNGSDFSQNLSEWKVPLIKSAPSHFNAVIATNQRGGKIPLDQYPQWGEGAS